MLQEIAAKIGTSAYALAWPGDPFYWLYLLSAAILALAVCLWRSPAHGLARLIATLREVFDPKVFFHRSAMVDYRFVFLNHLLSIFALGAGVASAQVIAQGGAALLARAVGPSPALTPGLAPSAALTLVLFVAGDFANFYFHRLQHRVPFLWELHKVHHSAEVLTPLTALRVHPIAELLGAQFIAVCTALPAAVFLYLYGGPVAQVTILGVNAGMFLWHTVLGKHLAHMHVWVMFPKVLRGVFYSPALHLIHHSAHPAHFGKNLGFCLIVWDRLAGSLHEPSDGERRELVLGIDAADMGDYLTMRQLYWTPVRNILASRGRRALTA